MIHGVWVATRVGVVAVLGAPELHALKTSAIAPSTTIHFGLVIFTISPANFELQIADYSALNLPFAICDSRAAGLPLFCRARTFQPV
jgi:hypothetical protein